MSSHESPLESLRELASRYCDGQLTCDEVAALEVRLHDDPAALEQFVLYMELHAQIAWNVRAGAEGSPVETMAERQLARGIALPAEDESAASSPPIILNLSEPQSDASGWFAMPSTLLSYGVAAAIVVLGLIAGWVSQVSQLHPAPVAANADGLAGKTTDPEMNFVGRVTGMEDCRLSDDTQTTERSFVALGRHYVVESGLMEITYDSGAKVILQGPATYEVVSEAGGFLSAGKLTARVDKKPAPKTAASPAGSNESAVQEPTPLFTVHTPSATVTDLGTEFGVAVDKQGQTETRVYQGQVRVVPLGGHRGQAWGTVVNAGQAVRCVANRPLTVNKAGDIASNFVRTLRRQPNAISPVRETFSGPALGSAFEQYPAGRYAIGHGEAAFIQPPLARGEQYRGYIRTLASDFCYRDFTFEATFDVQMERPDPKLQAHGHYIFFGIGDGFPNPDFFDEVSRGLVLAFCVDNGYVFVRACKPGATIENTTTPVTEVLAPGTLPSSGHYRFRLTKQGKFVRFAIDVRENGQFQERFASHEINLLDAAPYLNSATSRLLVGTGNCDTMSVRFQELSIVFPKNEGTGVDSASKPKPVEAGRQTEKK